MSAVTVVGETSHVQENNTELETIQVQIHNQTDPIQVIDDVIIQDTAIKMGESDSRDVVTHQGTAPGQVIMFKWGSHQKPYRCQICDMSFDDASKMCEHLSKHEDSYPQKPFPCTVCPKSFSSAKSLERHTLTHYCQTLKRCKYCYKVFVNKENLEKHIVTHGGMKPHRCNECGEQFVYRQGLETHKLTHTGARPFVCKICEKGFNRKDILERHMQVHSKDGKKYKCVECNKTFSHKFVLKRHARAIHSGEEEGATCKYCNKYIRSKENLNRHMKIHTGERPYKCQKCDRAFTQKQHLIDHSVLHTSDMPHQCQHCGENFKHRRSLNRHLLKHRTCNLICTKCPHAFKEQSELEKHLQKHQMFKHQCPHCYSLFKIGSSLQRHLWKCMEKRAESGANLGQKDCSEMATTTDDLHLYADIISEWEVKEEERRETQGDVAMVQEVISVDDSGENNHDNNGQNNQEEVVVILVDQNSGEQVVLEAADWSTLTEQMNTNESLQSLLKHVKQAGEVAGEPAAVLDENVVTVMESEAEAPSGRPEEMLSKEETVESRKADEAPTTTMTPVIDMTMHHNYVKETSRSVAAKNKGMNQSKSVTLVPNDISVPNRSPCISMKTDSKVGMKPIIVPRVVGNLKQQPKAVQPQTQKVILHSAQSSAGNTSNPGHMGNMKVVNVKPQPAVSLNKGVQKMEIITVMPGARKSQVYIQEDAGRVSEGGNSSEPVIEEDAGRVSEGGNSSEPVIEEDDGDVVQSATVELAGVQKDSAAVPQPKVIYLQDQSMVTMETDGREIHVPYTCMAEGDDGSMTEGDRNLLIQTVIEYAESLREPGHNSA